MTANAFHSYIAADEALNQKYLAVKPGSWTDQIDSAQRADGVQLWRDFCNAVADCNVLDKVMDIKHPTVGGAAIIAFVATDDAVRELEKQAPRFSFAKMEHL